MNYQEFKQAVIDFAAQQNITDYELYYSKSDSTEIETFQTQVKGFSTNSSMGICFRCIIDGQTGYASTENLTEAEAHALVLRAVENAKSIENETTSFIHVKGDAYRNCEHKETLTPSSQALIDFALALQKETYAQDERVVDGTQTAAGCTTVERAILNSNGLDLNDQASFDYCFCQAIVSENDEMYSGLEITSGTLETLDQHEVAKQAVTHAVESIGYTTVDSGEYTIVFSNEVMANLLSTYASIFSAESAQKGLSLLNGKENTAIASEVITLTDDPFHPDALIPSAFDDEGAATYKKNVIENGTFVTFLHNLSTADKAGVKTTGNGYKSSYAAPIGVNYYNFYINPVKGSLEDLFAQTGDGIYITSVEGLHAGANPITGDFSLSSGGFRIENGKKTFPIKGITISGNFLQLLQNISAVGEDLKFDPWSLSAHRCGSPSLIVKGISVAGK